ncbi:hypothetical protein BH23VER1_BH23VER1_22580 [soil metagenome]
MGDESDEEYDEAVEHLQMGELAEALGALERALMADSGDAQTWQLYSVVLTALGRPEDAERAGAKAGELGLDPVDGLLMKAAEATVTGKKAEAICHYEDALEIDAGRFEIWTSYALLLLDEGYKSDALEASGKAVALEGGEAQVWYARGRVLRLCGDTEGALPAFDRAVELDPNLAPAWHERGMVMVTGDRLDEALECFEKVLELAPDDPSATQAKAIVQAKMGT